MRVRLMLLGACVLFVSSLLALPASAQTTPDDNVGFTRFAHTAVDVGPVDIYLGDQPQPVVTNLKYGDVTDFIALPDNLSGYTARAAGSPANSTPLFSLNWGVKANKSEIIIAAGLNSHKAFILEPVTLTRNDTKGKARVEVFDTVWGGAALSVDATQGITFSQGQEYLKASNNNDIAPGTYDFEVKDGAGKILATAPGVSLEADKVYTLLIMGSADGNPPIKLVPVISDEETTRVQIVNQSGNAVDVYVKGETTPFISGLANGTNSDWTTLPSGALTLVLRNAGSAPTGQEVAFVATQFRPGRDMVITITPSGKSVQMNVTSDVLSQPSSAFMQATLNATMNATMEATLQATAAQ